MHHWETGQFRMEVAPWEHFDAMIANSPLAKVHEMGAKSMLLEVGGDDGVVDPEQGILFVGPYELQDFHLYYFSRFGYRPSKVAFLALQAWGDAGRGEWPELISEGKRRTYDLATLRRWQEVFLRRFFKVSQFKRSAIPNAPKVGSGGSLSPRSDWRAPSDAGAEAWIDELRRHVPEK